MKALVDPAGAARLQTSGGFHTDGGRETQFLRQADEAGRQMMLPLKADPVSA